MPYIEQWDDQARRGFRTATVLARHRLAETGLFTDAALADLLERHDRDLSDFCTMADTGAHTSWRCSSDDGGRSGESLLDEVRSGRLWINLRQIVRTDPVYADLVGALYAELKALNPGFRPAKVTGGLLISSPSARVPFHIDRTDTMLWHIRGRKRVYVYPKQEPLLSEREVEDVLIHPNNDDLPYDSGFDARADVFDLTPGEVLSWPVHHPHRVDNLEDINVSLTTEYTTPDVFLRNNAMYFNGVMRRRFGWKPGVETSRGVDLAARAGLGFAMKKLGLTAPAVYDPHPEDAPVFAPR